MPNARKHGSGYWQAFIDDTLIIGALFKRKRDAVQFSAHFLTFAAPSYTQLRESLKQFGGFIP